MAETTKGKVLILDDEVMVTRNLEALLRLESPLEPEPFNDAREALEFLRRGEPVEVLLVDFVMPVMNGLEFLQRAREAQPWASRILLTGYADKESAIRAINEVGLYQYLEKPWENDVLLMVLHNAAERTRLLRVLDEKTRSLEELRGQIWRLLV